MKFQRLIELFIVFIMLLILAGIAKAQNKNLDTAVLDESFALKKAQEWAFLVSNADVAGLEKLLSDQYIHVHATARVENKEQFLEAFKNGSRKYDPIKIEDVNVGLFESFAIVTGKFNLKAYARGKTIEGVNMFVLVLTKTNNGQQVVFFQATAIPQPTDKK